MRLYVKRGNQVMVAMISALLASIFFFWVWQDQINHMILEGLNQHLANQVQVLRTMKGLDYDAPSHDLLQETNQIGSEDIYAILISQDQITDGQTIREPLWTNYNYRKGQVNYQPIRDHLKEKNTTSDPIITWRTSSHYFNAMPVVDEGKDRIWMIEYRPTTFYRPLWIKFWTTLLISFVIEWVTIVVLLRIFTRKVSQPLRSIEEGVRGLLQEDYSYEYISHSIPEVNRLGHQVNQLVEYLDQERNEVYAGQQQYSLLLENINLGVLVIDPHGHIDMFNPALQDILLIESGVLGRPYQGVIKSFQLINLINNVIRSHMSIQEEVEIYVPQAKFVEATILPYRESERSEPFILVLLYDITEIRRLETVRSEFVANASHELRTPITAIKGFAETLLDGAIKEPGLSEKFIRIIAKESQRLEMIVEDILELSRVEKQNHVQSRATFDLVEAAQNMVDFLSQKLKAKNIKVKLVSEGSTLYTGDQHRLEQILTNLIDNAINYSEANSRITIQIKGKKKKVELIVADTGIGIPEDELDRIFERFYRVNKDRSRNSGGTGLGLSIVRNLVKTMNGKIEVESQVGVGTRFTVTLPYH